MPEDYRVRAYNARQDLEQMYCLTEVAYAEDYRRIDRDPRAGMARERRVVAALSGLGRIFPALRDVTSGFVREEEGRIVCFVHFARVGLAGDRWSIETVMTDPGCRRRGYARELIGLAVDEIRRRGGRHVSLKVRADNEPAIRLYRSLGFAPVDATVQLKRSAAPSAVPVDWNKYRARRATVADWYGSWEARFVLGQRETPEPVKEGLPVTAHAYRRPALVRVLAPIFVRMSGRHLERWLIERSGKLVATLSIDGDPTGERTHEIALHVDPAHEAALAARLVACALDSLSRLPPLPILAETRPSNRAILDALRAHDFEAINTWHTLGLPLAG